MADSATVGTLKVLLQADVSAFNAAMASATADVKKIGEALQKDLEPRQRAINAAVRDFLGTDEIRKAQEYAAAITKIGGTSTLTEANQRKVNKAVTDAIEQYKALGQQAPADLLKLQQATDKIEPSGLTAKFADLGKEIKSTAVGFAAGLVTVDALKAGFDTLTDFVGDCIKSFLGAEASAAKVDAALRSNGTYSKALSQQYQDLASEMESLTVNSDDLNSEAIALFTSMGQVGPDRMKAALTAASDLSAGLGIDLLSAVKLVSQAFEGNVGSLGRYGIAVDKATDSGQQMDNVLAAINSRFGGQAEAQIHTTAGQLSQLANAWDNVKEAIGGVIVQSPVFQGSLAAINALLKQQQEAADKAAESYDRYLAKALTRGLSLPRAEGFGKDIPLTAPVSGNATTDYVAALAAARSELEKLTPTMRAQIDAALKMGESQETIASHLHVSADALKVYQSASKDAAKSTSDHAKAIESLASSMSRSAVIAQINLMADAVAKLQRQNDLSAQAMPNLIKQLRDWVSHGYELPPALQAIWDKQKALDDELSAGLAFQQEADRDRKNNTIPTLKTQADSLKKVFENLGHIVKLPPPPPLYSPEAIQHMNEAIASLDTAKSLIDDLGRNMTGTGRLITAAFSAGISIVKDYISALEAGKAAQVALSASVAQAFVVGISAGFAAVQASHARFQAITQDVKDYQEQIRALGGTPIEDTRTGLAKIGNKQYREYADQLKGQLADLQKQQDDLNASMGRYNLTLSQTGTPAEQFSRQVSQMVDDFQRLNANGFGVDTITKGATDQLNSLLQTAIQTGQKLPAALQPYIDQLATSGGLTDELKRQILGLADPTPWQDMQTAAEKYGISVDSLGSRFQQAKLDDTVKQLISDWKLLTENGADANAVMDGMRESVQGVIDDALRFGATIPDTMRPMIEKMAEAGELTDDQGDKLTDLTKLSFSHDLSEDFQTLIDKLNEFIDKITGPGGLSDALTNLPQPQINWSLSGSALTPQQQADYDASVGDLSKGSWVGRQWVINTPQMAGGGVVLPRPGGTLVNIAEKGYPETVLPGDWSDLVAAADRMPNWDGAMAGIGVSPIDRAPGVTSGMSPLAVNISAGDVNLDGRKVGSVLWKPMIEDLQRRGVTR
jgi:hypothetical protein